MERKKENIFDFIEKCIAYITGISGDKGSVSEGDFLEDADRFRDKGYFLERMKEGVRFSPEVYYPEFRKSTYGYRFRRRLYKISSMAAVVVALLSTGYYFIGKSGERCGDDGIVPIHSKAYIKLEDGKIFYLDGLKTAVFSERENVKIVQDSGKIVYRTRRPYKHEIFNELNVPKGGEYVLELSDGTTVWMNADSKLRYPVNFSAEERVVYLTGEAFFSVVENKNKPFVVCASGGRISVLGTEFNVRNYPDEDRMQTTLVSGIVEYEAENCEKIRLQPGYQAEHIFGTSQTVLRKVNVDDFISWKEGIYLFDKTPLSEIMRTLSRNYDVGIVYEDEHLKTIRFSGKLKKYGNIEDFLRFIELAERVCFKIRGKEVHIFNR